MLELFGEQSTGGLFQASLGQLCAILKSFPNGIIGLGDPRFVPFYDGALGFFELMVFCADSGRALRAQALASAARCTTSLLRST